MFEAKGKDAKLLVNEAGGHRWQRVPPNEKRGRVHTSTVTVAVLDVQAKVFALDPRDVEFKTCRGSGAGGQHRNMTDSAVQATHRPSGLAVRVESERSQHQNKESALRLLQFKLAQKASDDASKATNALRKGQVGAGQRADKRRTIAVQRDSVVDHVSGKETSFGKYAKGALTEVW